MYQINIDFILNQGGTIHPSFLPLGSQICWSLSQLTRDSVHPGLVDICKAQTEIPTRTYGQFGVEQQG